MKSEVKTVKSSTSITFQILNCKVLGLVTSLDTNTTTTVSMAVTLLSLINMKTPITAVFQFLFQTFYKPPFQLVETFQIAHKCTFQEDSFLPQVFCLQKHKMVVKRLAHF